MRTTILAVRVASSSIRRIFLSKNIVHPQENQGDIVQDGSARWNPEQSLVPPLGMSGDIMLFLAIVESPRFTHMASTY